MALTGHLSDLSLSELIEFFCNQRKMGLLNVHYPQGAGSFYLQNGSVVDAKIGVLRGIDAVYYALTLPNAEFEFKAAAEPIERTINQPWTQVVLEGLRRLDEGIDPEDAFYNYKSTPVEVPSEPVELAKPVLASNQNREVPAFLSLMNPTALSQRKPLIIGVAAIAVLVSVAAIGVPAGWYGRAKPVATTPIESNSMATSATQPEEAKPEPTLPQDNSADAEAQAAEAALAAKRQKERRAREERANASDPKPVEPTSGAKKVTVQVTYDESGRVVQASGADPTALRIARQKRFPAGKGGTATITIPIN